MAAVADLEVRAALKDAMGLGPEAVVVAHVDRLSDASHAPRLDALCYLGSAENYLELYDDAVAHSQRDAAAPDLRLPTAGAASATRRRPTYGCRRRSRNVLVRRCCWRVAMRPLRRA